MYLLNYYLSSHQKRRRRKRRPNVHHHLKVINFYFSIAFNTVVVLLTFIYLKYNVIHIVSYIIRLYMKTCFYNRLYKILLKKIKRLNLLIFKLIYKIYNKLMINFLCR